MDSTNQKQYLQSLRSTGKKPEGPRPEFNGLSKTVDLIETVALSSDGNQRSVEETMVLLASSNPELDALIKEEKPTVEVVRDEQLYPPLPPGLALEPGATDGLCPLKDEYVAFSREKSPEGFEEFHPSCFWSMLSTVAARRVVINLESQYTPLSVMLAARSTLYAKTETAEVVRAALKAAGLDWLLGLTRTTPQKLLLDMSGPIAENYHEMDYESQKTLKIHLAMSAQRGWLYHEFGKLMRAMVQSNGPMSDFIGILLQISDGQDELPTGTIGRGNETIIKPYLSMLGTLTPASIRAFAGKHAELWSDGFLARVLWSCPPPNTYIDRPFQRGHTKVPTKLVTGIRNWHEQLGIPEIDIDPILSDEGKPTGRYRKQWLNELPEKTYYLSDDAYNGWVKYRSALKSMIVDLPHQDFDASYGRMGTMALRVAALAASVEGVSKIEHRHWILGQEQAELWRGSLHQLYAQVVSDGSIVESAPTQEDQLVEYLTTLEKETTAREILQYGPAPLRKLKSNGIRDMLSGLIKDGVIEKVRVKDSKAEWYKRIF